MSPPSIPEPHPHPDTMANTITVPTPAHRRAAPAPAASRRQDPPPVTPPAVLHRQVRPLGTLALAWLALSLGAAGASAQTPPPGPAAGASAPTASVPTTTPAIAGVVAAETRIELIRDGFTGTEGPIGLPDGQLLFTETPANRITQVKPDGSVSAFLEDSNGSNGLAFQRNGDLVAVQVLQPRVGIVHPPEHRKVLADQFEGAPFGRPNDLVTDRQGNIYFTDSGAAAKPGQPAPAPPAVYRITAQGALQRLVHDIERPNGIQLSPDEKTLYVANTAGEHVLAYDIGADGTLGPRRQFARLVGWRQTENGPSSGADGLAVDAQGRLYVASTAGIQVFSAQGQALGVIPLPKAPQNLAFAGPDKKTLYVVGRGSAYRIAVLTPGFQGRAK